jgi:hypothetical protein
MEQTGKLRAALEAEGIMVIDGREFMLRMELTDEARATLYALRQLDNAPSIILSTLYDATKHREDKHGYHNFEALLTVLRQMQGCAADRERKEGRLPPELIIAPDSPEEKELWDQGARSREMWSKPRAGENDSQG